MGISKIASLFSIVGLLFSIYAQGQNMSVPVIYYDYHADGSNPNFEKEPMNSGQGATKGMIQNTLSTDFKPVFRADLDHNDRVGDWFRPSDQGSSKFVLNPITNRYEWTGMFPYSGRANEFVTAVHSNANPMANVVIYDSLNFRLVNAASNTYQFSSQTFFPIDGRGFGAEPTSYPAYQWTNTGNHNYSFTMEIHQKFTYQKNSNFSFEGDDDVWAFIDGKLVMDIGGIHGPIRDSINLNTLGLTENKSYQIDFFYAERHVTGSDILITTNMFTPNPPSQLNISLNASSVACGSTVTATAIIKDRLDSTHVEYDSLIRWSKNDPWNNPALAPTIGKTTTFAGTEAYHSVYLIATLTVPENGQILKDSVKIDVLPGPADHIVIEASPTIKDSLSNQPIDSILIPSTDNTATAYAVVRDACGNFVRLANATTTQWTSRTTTVATAAPVASKAYQGQITRVAAGSTQIVASEPGVLPDSVVVKVADYYIVRVRCFDLLASPPHAISLINMNTGEEGRYQAQGLRSNAVNNPNDPASWVVVSVKWALSTPLKSEIAPPDLFTEWNYKPINPGTGTLTLTYSSTVDTVINVTITPEVPKSVTIKLLTPPEQRIAGEKILAEVRVFNSDGLVPGKYCYGTNGNNPNPAVYQDILGNGGRPANPTIIVDGQSTILNQSPLTTYTSNECFNDGVDTVQAVLYYAPMGNDTTHKITVVLNPGLIASTENFKLLPGQLDSLAIEYENMTPAKTPDTLLYPNGFTVWYASGYDTWGNRIGFIPSNWSVDGTLHQPNDITNVNRVFYSTQNVKSNETGNLCAAAQGKNGVEVACGSISIIGPYAQLTSATTRDTSGNGYLDRIDLVFNKPVVIPPTFTGFTIKYGTDMFTIANIVKITDSVYQLVLVEDTARGPQTSWLPLVNITGLAGANPVTNFVTADGAPPVVWKVVKTVRTLDRKDDLVSIYMSEKIYDPMGNQFSVTHFPGLVYQAWRDNGTGPLSLDSSMFSGIPFFSQTVDSVLTFTMANSKDLTTLNWVNILSTSMQIKDLAGNYPTVNNKQVRVEIKGEQADIKVFPNPSAPTFKHIPPGVLNLYHEPDSYNWVKQDKAGSIIRLRLTVLGTTQIRAYMKIYDLVGNLVQTAEQENILNPTDAAHAVPKDVTMYDLYIYWNQSNAQGMKCSPGIYRIVVFLDYVDGKNPDQRLVATVGVGR